jgi:hypothetical protein
MSSFTKSSVEWAERHAECGSDHIWRCRETKEQLMVAWVGRSIWWRPFAGGPGEVRRVGHVFCPVCMPEAKFPEPGTPIMFHSWLRRSFNG